MKDQDCPATEPRMAPVRGVRGQAWVGREGERERRGEQWVEKWRERERERERESVSFLQGFSCEDREEDSKTHLPGTIPIESDRESSDPSSEDGEQNRVDDSSLEGSFEAVWERRERRTWVSLGEFLSDASSPNRAFNRERGSIKAQPLHPPPKEEYLQPRASKKQAILNSLNLNEQPRPNPSPLDVLPSFLTPDRRQTEHPYGREDRQEGQNEGEGVGFGLRLEGEA